MENKLTDEEVWLRAYCASISNSTPSLTQYAWQKDADACLDDFRKKFRSVADNERNE